VADDSALLADQGRWLESAREAEHLLRGALDRFGSFGELTLEQALRVRDLATEAAVAASSLRQQAERRIGTLRREQTLLDRRVIPLAARRAAEVESWTPA
jgi:hypothetical protein